MPAERNQGRAGHTVPEEGCGQLSRGSGLDLSCEKSRRGETTPSPWASLLGSPKPSQGVLHLQHLAHTQVVLAAGAWRRASGQQERAEM